MTKPKKTKLQAQTVRQSPSSAEVIQARYSSGLTVMACAALIYVTRRMWHKYEKGQARMHPAYFELYKIKTGQF